MTEETLAIIKLIVKLADTIGLTVEADSEELDNGQIVIYTGCNIPVNENNETGLYNFDDMVPIPE